MTQGGGSKNLEQELVCDLGVGDWTRTGDNVPHDIFWDWIHESHDEPWQWFDNEKEQFKSVLSYASPRQGGGDNLATLRLHENNVSTRNNEYWYQRFGTEL